MIIDGNNMMDPMLLLAQKYSDYACEIELICNRLMHETSELLDAHGVSDTELDIHDLIPKVACALKEQSSTLAETASCLRHKHDMYASLDESIADRFR